MKNFVLSLPIVKCEFETVDVYAEVASEFLLASMIIELANIAEVKVNRGKITDWLLSFKNRDGGFGAHRLSNLNSTYHAVTSLFNLGYNVKSLKDTLEYIRACEKPLRRLHRRAKQLYTFYGACVLRSANN
ncbi:MAG: hypothetical protein N3F10_02840 [Candidatus Bathyarchaeota archaeon]|nr:hypothetical protein [Candidatus Bathyarchaeota archaeon]MCX8177219.1 hypothetical protein [Candidatus Bathyarchaeota archaeon]MDW8193538.1 hypothetical protein [Nitrososphaerota archaeon]